MKNNFDVQSIGINRPANKVFEFISKPENLSLWTNAFAQANQTSAIMVTPNGELSIGLETLISKENGTIDWVMTMPDASIGKAFSRVSENGKNAIYSFVLLAPPVPLEQLEGALSAQKIVLAEELKKLKNLLEIK
ncbi:hypothetical protein [Maribacter sp.]|uniref:hypothetical protein n=1 Tax=Maribacter sp. TaxID=1897614 RepID=UPI0025C5CC23|nr:hypothetical protein [Maribacter sp.]